MIDYEATEKTNKYLNQDIDDIISLIHEGEFKNNRAIYTHLFKELYYWYSEELRMDIFDDYVIQNILTRFNEECDLETTLEGFHEVKEKMEEKFKIEPIQ